MIEARTAKGSFSKMRLLWAGASVLALNAGWGMAPALAGPQDGQVVQGRASIKTQGQTTTIRQNSKKAIITWDDFDIGAGERVDFDQPSKKAITLNRVTGDSRSDIDGTLTAKGSVWLVNPNGVMIGPNARIDVHGVVATTADIRDSDFLDGRYDFTKPSANPNAEVVNAGTITLGDHGLAALVAPHARNDGVIEGRFARVAVGGAETFSLDLHGDGLMWFAIEDPAAMAEGDGTRLAANSGTIDVPGGRVLMTAGAAADVVGDVINTDGVIAARSVRQQDGVIVLDGSGAGGVNVAGTLDVSGADEGTAGGTLSVLGDTVTLEPQARLSASGPAGGGAIKIGGALQGQGPEPNAVFTTIKAGAEIEADATDTGDGGEVIVWADDHTQYEGAISARGGPNGGDGGFVEVSGKQSFVFAGPVDAGAPQGNLGTLLLDPIVLTITEGAEADNADGLVDNPGGDPTVTVDPADPPTTASLTNDAVQAVAANLIITAQDLTVDAPLVFTSPETQQFIGLIGTSSLTVNQPITLQSGIAALALRATGQSGQLTVNAPINWIANGASDLDGGTGNVLLTGSFIDLQETVTVGPNQRILVTSDPFSQLPVGGSAGFISNTGLNQLRAVSGPGGDQIGPVIEIGTTRLSQDPTLVNQVLESFVPDETVNFIQVDSLSLPGIETAPGSGVFVNRSLRIWAQSDVLVTGVNSAPEDTVLFRTAPNTLTFDNVNFTAQELSVFPATALAFQGLNTITVDKLTLLYGLDGNYVLGRAALPGETAVSLAPFNLIDAELTELVIDGLVIDGANVNAFGSTDQLLFSAPQFEFADDGSGTGNFVPVPVDFAFLTVEGAASSLPLFSIDGYDTVTVDAPLTAAAPNGSTVSITLLGREGSLSQGGALIVTAAGELIIGETVFSGFQPTVDLAVDAFQDIVLNGLVDVKGNASFTAQGGALTGQDDLLVGGDLAMTAFGVLDWIFTGDAAIAVGGNADFATQSVMSFSDQGQGGNPGGMGAITTGGNATFTTTISAAFLQDLDTQEVFELFVPDNDIGNFDGGLNAFLLALTNDLTVGGDLSVDVVPETGVALPFVPAFSDAISVEQFRATLDADMAVDGNAVATNALGDLIFNGSNPGGAIGDEIDIDGAAMFMSANGRVMGVGNLQVDGDLTVDAIGGIDWELLADNDMIIGGDATLTSATGIIISDDNFDPVDPGSGSISVGGAASFSVTPGARFAEFYEPDDDTFLTDPDEGPPVFFLAVERGASFGNGLTINVTPGQGFTLPIDVIGANGPVTLDRLDAVLLADTSVTGTILVNNGLGDVGLNTTFFLPDMAGGDIIQATGNVIATAGGGELFGSGDLLVGGDLTVTGEIGLEWIFGTDDTIDVTGSASFVSPQGRIGLIDDFDQQSAQQGAGTVIVGLDADFITTLTPALISTIDQDQTSDEFADNGDFSAFDGGLPSILVALSGGMTIGGNLTVRQTAGPGFEAPLDLVFADGTFELSRADMAFDTDLSVGGTADFLNTLGNIDINVPSPLFVQAGGSFLAVTGGARFAVADDIISINGAFSADTARFTSTDDFTLEATDTATVDTRDLAAFDVLRLFFDSAEGNLDILSDLDLSGFETVGFGAGEGAAITKAEDVSLTAMNAVFEGADVTVDLGANTTIETIAGGSSESVSELASITLQTEGPLTVGDLSGATGGEADFALTGINATVIDLDVRQDLILAAPLRSAGDDGAVILSTEATFTEATQSADPIIVADGRYLIYSVDPLLDTVGNLTAPIFRRGGDRTSRPPNRIPERGDRDTNPRGNFFVYPDPLDDTPGTPRTPLQPPPEDFRPEAGPPPNRPGPTPDGNPSSPPPPLIGNGPRADVTPTPPLPGGDPAFSGDPTLYYSAGPGNLGVIYIDTTPADVSNTTGLPLFGLRGSAAANGASDGNRELWGQ